MFIIKKEYFNCDNNNKEIVNCDTQIGFTFFSYHKVIFLCLSLLGILFSFIVLIDYIKEKIDLRKRRKKYSSMKKIFKVLQILDFFNSLYFLISSTIFINMEKIKNRMTLAAIFSFFYIFLLSFNLTYINCMLTHFRKLNFDPFESIIKSNSSFIHYIIRCLIISSVISVFSYFLGILGKSPMNTCFINTELNRESAIVYIFIFLLILFTIYKIVHGLYFSKMFINKDKERALYIQNSLYALIYCGMHIPMVILFIITFFRQKNIVETDIFLPEFSYFCTILLFFSPLVNKTLSFYQGMLRLKCLEKCMKPKKSLEETTKILNNDLTMSLTVYDQYDWLDKHAIEFFMRNILLGIAISINKSKKLENKTKFNKNDFVDSIKHEINFTNFDLNDDETRNSEYLDIKVIEYAPYCFKYLRELENIDIDNMVKCFLPQNNKMGLKKSAGKSGSFFISTDNGEYMIKTLKSDEFEIIRNSFLSKYIDYIRDNPKSLLCRIYGIYNLIQYNGSDFYIIVMRNVIGSLKDYIVAKFDLKGSTTNRKVKSLDMTKIDNDVMKDLNFNEIEFGILLSNKNIEKIRALTAKDSAFLAKLGLMDYSLFIVKLSLNKNISSEIFGEGIQEQQQKDYIQVLNDKTVVGNSINDVSTILHIDSIQEANNEKDNKSIYKHYKVYLYPGLNLGNAYIISIIDYLQSYNFYKLVEYECKTAFGKDKTDNKGGISCVNPKLYSERFINYVNKLTQVKYILTDKQNE